MGDNSGGNGYLSKGNGNRKPDKSRPNTAAKPDRLRDPRNPRDGEHDMRMPPYMRDETSAALSLTRRQYDQIMNLADYLQNHPGPLDTELSRHISRVLKRRKGGKSNGNTDGSASSAIRQTRGKATSR